jgi:peptidase E
MSARGPYQWQFSGLIRHALVLSGKQCPRLCFVSTAIGDNDAALRASYGAAAGEPVQPYHLALYPMPNVDDISGFLCSMDVIWVGGGSVANLLAVWRVHGVDTAMHAAWESGVVLAGVSAGSICWHVGGTTDSFGLSLQVVTNGLGFLPYGNSVHHDSEEQRRPLACELVAEGVLPLTFATDDGVGLHYVGTELAEAVAETPGKSAWRIEPDGSGGAVEVEVAARLLGD